MTINHNDSVVGRILGGLYLELKERLPRHSVELGGMFGDPAVRVDTTWIVVDQDKFKVVVPNSSMNPATKFNSFEQRRVLFECSICHPDDDFSTLFEFFERYEDDFDDLSNMRPTH